MKLVKYYASAAVLLLASLVATQANSVLTTWSFDNLAVATNASPAPSGGFGSAGLVGLNSADVLLQAGSSTGAANSWRVTGTGANGWTTNSAIGTRGARFAASTLGYYSVKVSFDVYATADAQANLLVQYTTDGTIWNNATIASVATVGVVTNNADTNQTTVIGSYLRLGSGWNNGVVVDLSGISGVANNANFAVRMVNASTGANCVNTTGAIFSNNTGTWAFDNVVIQGVSFDTLAGWTFESYGTSGFVPNPIPEFGSGNAKGIGFDTSYAFSDGTVGSTNKPDTLVQAGSSTPNGTICWRLRGAGPGNGWHSSAPIGAQGAEFAVNTVNYSNILVTFDMYFTSQSEAKMCVLYTTDNWATTNNASSLAYGANPTFIFTNSAGPNFSSETVTGTYFWQNVGQGWYNNLVVDFTGVPGVDNNPNFAFRIVNAATGADCVAYNGGSYNNSSGNARFDNVTVGGTFNGSLPPDITYDATATVDRPFTNTFVDDVVWRSKIGSIYVNGSLLTNTAYTKNTAGQIVFNPTNSVLLQSAGVKIIVINATNYSSEKITQPISPGLATRLAISTQPAAPSASGGTLTVNPVITISDKYGNGTTNPYANVVVSAGVSNSTAWKLAGSTNQAAINGVAIFTNLSATVTGSSAVTGAAITFTISGYAPLAVTNSVNFNIGAPPTAFSRGNLAVVQVDTVANVNNSTFSIIEVRPSVSRQTTPVSITPISATGTNALRLNASASVGKLTLSDDGTLVSFVGFADESSATPDQGFTLDRAVGTLNYTNQFNKPFSYTSQSLGGSAGRSCATLDNINWLVADKGGLYINSLLWSLNNNVVIRTFGGIPYVQTQKTASGSPIPVVYALNMSGPDTINNAVPNNLLTDPIAVDFYIITSNNVPSVMYILDQVSATVGIIKKYSWVNDINFGWQWNASGTFTNGNGGDSLFATTNGSGGVYLFYTTGGGGTAGNSIVRLTDSAGYNAPITIVSSNVIYTAASTATIKGLTFVPQQTAYAVQLIPPPVLITQTVASVSSIFSITNAPDDSAWRAAITSVTVNGSTLPPAAYNRTIAGRIAFDPAQSALLQTPGVKTIAFYATGYGSNTVSQSLAIGAPAKLGITTQPTAPVANGLALAAQPVVVVQDIYGNTITTATSNILAQVGSGTWTLGGTTTRAAVAGVATFTGLTASSVAAVNGATIQFTSAGLTSVTSSTFNIPSPQPSNITGAAITGGKFKLGFTNSPGLTFSVLATNSLTAPRATWPVIGQAVEGPAGQYNFTNSAPVTNSPLFFLIRQP